MRRSYCLPLAIITCLAAACGGQPHWYDSPIGPGTAAIAITDLAIDPRSLAGGATARGVVSLNAPAPSSTTIVLSASSSAISVPASIAVTTGATTVSFALSSAPVTTDATVTITARLGTSVLNATVTVVQPSGSFFAWDSDVGDWVGGGQSGYVANSQLFFAVCDVSTVYFQIRGNYFDGSFGAPAGQPLRVGTYDNASSSPGPLQPSLLIGGQGRGCTATGQFVIEEAELRPMGEVDHLVMRFQQRCEGSSAAFRGQLRLVSPSLGAGAASPPRCLR